MRLHKFFTHLNIIFGGLFTVLYFLDNANPEMEYITGPANKIMLLCFCICAITQGIITLLRIRDSERKGSL